MIGRNSHGLILDDVLQSCLSQQQRDGLDKIQRLDLSKVKLKLGKPEIGSKGEVWTPEQVSVAEFWYKRFLILILLRPGHKRVPNGVVDAFWHQHILDTRSYFKDIMDIFGRFLHHDPYFGIRAELGGNDDRKEHARCFRQTCRDLHDLFGEDYSATESLFPGMSGLGWDCCELDDECSDEEM